MASNLQIKYTTAVLLMTLQLTTSIPAKPNARPVHEIINEQSRMDEKRPPNNPGNLPFGNPLAGNSKQTARLHAQSQQAMFHAERVRQHRAQLQRWTKAPPKVDSYMKAYHDSQESHQLAIEKQQARTRDNRQVSPVTLSLNPVTKAPPKLRQVKENAKRAPKPETLQITKEDAVIKTEKNRNHRSYGSVEYQQYLQPKRYQTVYVSPAPVYDQGVTIKPNGNVGLTQLKSAPEESKLYTAAVPSKTQYVYPKQYNQMQSYQSAHDIDNLSALLKKNPTDQLSELSALLHSGKHSSDESEKDTLNTPVDLFFYLKDSPSELHQHYDHSYAESEPNYAKDHTPITEEIDDIEDPNKHPRLKAYGIQSALATQAPEESIDTTTTKSNNYYKVEVASQTISAPYNPAASKQHYYYKESEEAKPTYETLHYRPTYPTHYSHKDEAEEDLNERYLHHNAQHVGIQHLSEDGTGVSAYGDDNLHYAANYEFGYRVRDHHTGNDFGHHEAKRGDNTRGHYHVLLPDGRMQKVKYSAGPEGFHADISYDHLQ